MICRQLPKKSNHHVASPVVTTGHSHPILDENSESCIERIHDSVDNSPPSSNSRTASQKLADDCDPDVSDGIDDQFAAICDDSHRIEDDRLDAAADVADERQRHDASYSDPHGAPGPHHWEPELQQHQQLHHPAQSDDRRDDDGGAFSRRAPHEAAAAPGGRTRTAAARHPAQSDDRRHDDGGAFSRRAPHEAPEPQQQQHFVPPEQQHHPARFDHRDRDEILLLITCLMCQNSSIVRHIPITAATVMTMLTLVVLVTMQHSTSTALCHSVGEGQ